MAKAKKGSKGETHEKLTKLEETFQDASGSVTQRVWTLLADDMRRQFRDGHWDSAAVATAWMCGALDGLLTVVALSMAVQICTRGNGFAPTDPPFCRMTERIHDGLWVALLALIRREVHGERGAHAGTRSGSDLRSGHA